MLERLQKVPMCKGLTTDEAKQLASIAVEASAKRGEKLFDEGAPGDSIIVVLEGKVDIVRSGQSLAQLGEGSVFGEMSLLGEGGKRTATATVADDVKMLKIDAKKFQGLLAKNDLAALKVVTNLAQVMSKRLLAMNDKLIESTKGKKDGLGEFQKILNDWSF
ncbi:MAG: cyclic nucleotide-binding domain-containing protein [Myxococcaceae bacterium]|nr:cyclic nucleotide-binding domain-containing protein [Myxococcaceae bacterium]